MITIVISLTPVFDYELHWTMFLLHVSLCLYFHVNSNVMETHFLLSNLIMLKLHNPSLCGLPTLCFYLHAFYVTWTCIVKRVVIYVVAKCFDSFYGNEMYNFLPHLFCQHVHYLDL